MKKIKIIGLTGQSGAGKSTVAGFIESSRVCVINADLLVKQIYNRKSACVKSLAAAFGSDILDSDGTLNRPLLAKRAFLSKENTQLLNSLVHPFVVAEFLKECKKAAASGAETVVFDAPQLFECNADVFCDEIVSVIADAKTRTERICKRDGITPEQAQMRINAQLDEQFFRENSDYIIDNNGDIADVKMQVKEIFSDD